jgi:hypothetical protein
MMYNTISQNVSNSYFEYDFKKECAKTIPHHLINGPCSICIVRAMCEMFCNDLLKYFNKSSYVERHQILNYFDRKNKKLLKEEHEKSFK